jgi:hypothetical protein
LALAKALALLFGGSVSDNPETSTGASTARVCALGTRAICTLQARTHGHSYVRTDTHTRMHSQGEHCVHITFAKGGH